MTFEIIVIQQLQDNVSQRLSLTISLTSLTATMEEVFLTEVLLESSVDAVLKQVMMLMPFLSDFWASICYAPWQQLLIDLLWVALEAVVRDKDRSQQNSKPHSE